MAHKKAGGTATNLKDSPGKRLGVKLFAGERCRAGNILVRQRGSCFTPGENTMMGSDHTVFAITDGVVSYRKKQKTCFDGRHKEIKIVTVKKIEASSVKQQPGDVSAKAKKKRVSAKKTVRTTSKKR